MEEMSIALLRKALFTLLLMASYVLFDRVLLRGFNTAERVSHDPQAVANLLGLVCLAIAIS
jgi:hypothetical protein